MTKGELHEALQEHARQMAGVPPMAFLSRWVLVREIVLPDTGAKALNFVTGDASGQTLALWDAEALIRGYLRELNDQGYSPPPPRSSPPPEGGGEDMPF